MKSIMIAIALVVASGQMALAKGAAPVSGEKIAQVEKMVQEQNIIRQMVGPNKAPYFRITNGSLFDSQPPDGKLFFTVRKDWLVRALKHQPDLFSEDGGCVIYRIDAPGTMQQ